MYSMIGQKTLVNPVRKLDAKERKILAAFEAGKLKRVKNHTRELAPHRKAAEATFAIDNLIGQTVEQPTKRAT